MTALGYTWADAPPPERCRTTGHHGVALVTSDPGFASDARARLRLQVACASHFGAFLPLAPRRRIEAEAAVTWLASQADTVRNTLRHLSGKVQFTLAGAKKARVRAETLRARASARRQASEDAAKAAETLSRALRPITLKALKAHSSPGQVTLDILCDRPGASGPHEIAAALSTLHLPSWQLSLTGPWPAYAFAPEGVL